MPMAENLARPELPSLDLPMLPRTSFECKTAEAPASDHTNIVGAVPWSILPCSSCLMSEAQHLVNHIPPVRLLIDVSVGLVLFGQVGSLNKYNSNLSIS